ncbi:serine protease [Patescibacteria group bacterium]|nr:serine protease [Patescibacteria group bacterium]MBU4274482.1 serine protease [Patescibacteria group bacterium]MBU4367387.1 serine protease [Patescibacteria group bacterium]MBU4461708.1 serine protease [Patescibacteria group bacterium]MCG2700091.1 serine protease [Candidatus Parcubacteria bacterium]
MVFNNKKLIVLVFSVFLGGLISGLIFQILIFPYFLTHPYFSQFEFVKNFKEGNVIINTREEIIVTQETALEKAIDKVEKSVIGIQTIKDQEVFVGSGLIATSDGLIITLAELVPTGGTSSVILDGEKIKAQVLKRDSENNLALLKIEKTNLKTCGFCSTEQVRIGGKVFLMGITPSSFLQTVNEGIIKRFNEEIVRTNIIESLSLTGSPLFNIEGNLIGLSLINYLGQVSTIPIQKIKEFAGF